MALEDELDRWPGYAEQSWAERFAELDRRYKRLGDFATAFPLAALIEQKAPVEVEGLVERLREGCPCELCRADRAADTPQSQATELATLKQQLAEREEALREARKALTTIAQNDEFPLDADGRPMPIRPQWSSHQCSSIARQALTDKGPEQKDGDQQ